jgi:hypothetical protein
MLAALMTIVSVGCAAEGPTSDPVFSLAGAPGQVRVQRILTPATFSMLGASPTDDFDVDAHGRVVVANNDVLYVLEPGDAGIQALPLARVVGLRGVAVDGSAAMLLLTNTSLSEYYDGSVHALLDLPESASISHIAAAVDEQKLYAYGSDSSDANFSHHIVEIDPDGTVRSSVETDKPVTAVTERDGSLYFATPGEIYRWHDGHLSLIIRLPDNLSVKSVAAGDGILYFSTADEVYALKGLTAVSITRNLGGTLRSYEDSLYVMDAPRKFLVRLDGMQNL